MARRLIVVLALLAGSFHLSSGRALGCSCMGGVDPRDRLATADAAFIGELIQRGEPTPGPDGVYDSGQKVTYMFKVDESVKGELGPTVDVRSSSDGASCGIGARVGQRIGLLLHRQRSVWTSGLCSTMAPDELRRAAEPIPEPTSEGPVALVVGGSYGDVRTIALDADGQTVAYARGGGSSSAFDMCRSDRIIAELVHGVVDEQWWTTGIVVRDPQSLRVIREVRVTSFEAHNPSDSVSPSEFACLDADGTTFGLYGTNDGDVSKLVRVDGDGEHVLFDGPAKRPVAFSSDGRYAYIAQGDGTTLTRVDLASGEQRQLGRLPYEPSQLKIDPSGRSVAGCRGSELFLFDLASGSITSGRGGGTIVWIDDERFVLSGESSSVVRLYDRSLSVIDSWEGERVAWTAYGNGELYAARQYTGDVLSAPARTGPQRRVASFDTPELFTLAYVPQVDRPAPPTPSPTPEPTPTPTDAPLSPAPFAGSSSEPTNGARLPLAATGGALGIAAAGLAVAYTRRRS